MKKDQQQQERDDNDQEIREICLRSDPEHLLKKYKDELAWLPLFIHVMVRFTELVPQRRMSPSRVAKNFAMLLDAPERGALKRGALTKAYREVAKMAHISEDAVRQDVRRVLKSLQQRTK